MTGSALAGILAAFAVSTADGQMTAPSPAIVAPAPVIVAPPRVVMPPQVVAVGTTGAFHAPHLDFNLFVFSGRYYSFHQGVWFQSTTYNGPWARVAVERVPRPVLAVPVVYYKVPPGHAKKHGHHAMERKTNQ